MTPTTSGSVHTARRLVVALPDGYDAARHRFETLVPEADVGRFYQMASWPAAIELAEINAPHGFMVYQRLDVAALMAGSSSFWKATQYLIGNHTIVERMFRHDPAVMLHAPLRLLIYADQDGATRVAVDQPSSLFDSFGHPEISAVGEELDALLLSLLHQLGAVIPADLDVAPEQSY